MMWPAVTPKSSFSSDVPRLRGNIKNSRYPPGSRASLDLTDCLPKTCIPVVVYYQNTVTALVVNPKKARVSLPLLRLECD